MKTKKSTNKSAGKKKMPAKLKPARPNCFPSEWFNDMPTPIFILDEAGKVLYANDSFCDLIRKRKKECLAVKPMDMMIDQEENKKFLKDLLQVYRGLVIARGVYNLHISNKSFRALLDISPVYDTKRKIVQYAMGVVLDNDAGKKLRKLRDWFK
ncbi:MAG: PAS domain-containing protein [Patescibacteria group bacterium]